MSKANKTELRRRSAPLIGRPPETTLTYTLYVTSAPASAFLTLAYFVTSHLEALVTLEPDGGAVCIIGTDHFSVGGRGQPRALGRWKK